MSAKRVKDLLNVCKFMTLEENLEKSYLFELESGEDPKYMVTRFTAWASRSNFKVSTQQFSMLKNLGDPVISVIKVSFKNKE